MYITVIKLDMLRFFVGHHFQIHGFSFKENKPKLKFTIENVFKCIINVENKSFN